MLTRADLAAIRAILETHYGWHHPLTQAVHQAVEAMPVESQPARTAADARNSHTEGINW